jgi:hypothetical protein
MELNRITEVGSIIGTYVTSIRTLTETMRQVTQDLGAIQVLPSNDIIVQARSNVQPTEFEILLYDIYVCIEE